MIPESYVPDEKTREVRDLVRRRHRLVETRTGFKSKVKAEFARRRGEKVAIVAAARKLMRAMYIMLKEEKTFRLDG